MKRVTEVVAVVLAISFLISACDSSGQPVNYPVIRGQMAASGNQGKVMVVSAQATQTPPSRGPAQATQTPVGRTPAQPALDDFSPFALTELVGMDVSAAGGESAGVVEEVVLDLETGLADFIVIQADESVGIGERFIPVPWGSLEIDVEEGDLLMAIDVEPETLADLPRLRFDPFPIINEPGWNRVIYTYWERETGQEVLVPESVLEEALAPRPASILGRNAAGMDVQSRDRRVLGTIEDFFINLENGAIEYLLIEEAGVDGRSIPVPVEVLEFNLLRRALVVPLRAADLNDAPALEEEREISPALEKELNRYYRAP